MRRSVGFGRERQRTILVTLSVVATVASPLSEWTPEECSLNLVRRRRDGEVVRGAYGRRVFTSEFMNQQIERVLYGELTLAELTRELDVISSVTPALGVGRHHGRGRE